MADENELSLIYIPAGQTGYWQPLDRRIFGNLKGRAKGRFNMAHCGREIPKLNMIWAIRCLLDCWQSIGQDDVLDAWSIHE
jgi:hypothetical protein